ncbi:hypothetical protein SAMD00019534_109960, partial [Acytostelium subglobosum LB1]|uniref:hypothetical protein n=1 Tax=Acytostelium subglobosum LB1 TaxID=1410327 RepID=UPI0006451187
MSVNKAVFFTQSDLVGLEQQMTATGVVNILSIVNFVADPLKVGKNLANDKEFIGKCITKALDTVPGIGPILSQTFALFWPKDPNAAVITKAALEARLKSFKDELMTLVDERIDKAMGEAWKMICINFFDNVKDSYAQLQEKVLILQKMISLKLNTTALQTQIRATLDSILMQAGMIINFANDTRFFKSMLPTYMQALMIQNSIFLMMNTYWIQFGIPPLVVSGIPAEGDNPAVKGLTQAYHDRAVDFMNLAFKLINDTLITPETRNTTEFDSFLSKVSNVLDTDMYLYPVPLVVGTTTVTPTSATVPVHKVPKKTGAYIYRCPFANFLPDQERQKTHHNKFFGVGDSITKCSGLGFNWNGSFASLDFALEEPRKVAFRVHGLYTETLTGLELTVNNEKVTLPLVQDDYPVMWQKDESKTPVFDFYDKKTTSGFTVSKQFAASQSFKVKLGVIAPEGVLKAFFPFIELIICD